MKHIKKFLYFFVLVSIINFARCDDFPATIERCKNEDNECLKNLWNKYIKSTEPNGIQELGIPNLHNYYAQEDILLTGKGALNILLKMNDVKLTGLDTMVIDKIIGFPRDPKEMTKFELIGHGSFVGLTGKYKVSGQILLLPVTGNSDGAVKFFNFKWNVTALTSTKMMEGKEYLEISKVFVNYISERNLYQFENILNNKKISDGVNRVLNENQELINNEIRQPAGKILADHFKKFFVAAFTKYPYSSFFLDA